MARAQGPTPELSIDAAQARRFLVRRQLLSPPRALPARPASVLEVVRRLGSLQFDPLEVPGARNHDLVLHARVSGYRREWCEGWLYGPDRQLVELYNKSLNLLPVSELPFYRVSWDRYAQRYDGGILQEQAPVVEAILDRIRQQGPLSTAAFSDLTGRVDWWWAKTRVSRAVMEALFVTGRIGIARREGNRRFYDLTERLLPKALLAKTVSADDAHLHRLLSRHRGVGLMGEGGASELVHGTVPAAERKRLTEQMVDRGLLVPAQVEGLREVRYLLREERALLAMPEAPASEACVTLVAPLDPLMWDRRLIRALFGFEYIWEVYTPEHKRRHGYYVLPLLFGDRLVGRIEPRLDRAQGVLRILGVWFEDGFDPLEAPHFLTALHQALGAYAAFVGAARTVWPRTRIGRALSGWLAALGPSPALPAPSRRGQARASSSKAGGRKG